jgi:hippurate hydrolase
MPIANRVPAMQEEVAAWRRDLHAHPEILYAVDRTAALVAAKLNAFGCDEVATGIGRTGVVGVIRGRKNLSGKVIGLRADMDALAMTEATGLSYASTIAGRMHACGHDGHTAMLLGAAKYLCETRNFDGNIVVIFQPAEEGGAGGKAMVEAGLMERWNIQEVYGLHNMPGIPTGQFAIRPGPLLAASDRIHIEVIGKGGHAAHPHECIDPVLVASQIVTGLNTIVARSIDPLEAGVISICMLHAGEAENVIPERAVLKGTARSLTAKVRDLIEARVVEVAEATAKLNRATAVASYVRGYPVTVNHPRQTAFAAAVAGDVCGADRVDANTRPLMGAEDFSYMLEARPGAFIFLGNGDTAGLHHPKYDFNDAGIPAGVSYWARLAEMALPT